MDAKTLARCKSDFRVFLTYAWRILGLPDPTYVQLDIAYSLQHWTQEGFLTRRMIQAFRGIGKSWITSAYVVWLLLNDPDEKILVVSASKIRSDDFSIFTKKLLMELPILNHLMPSRDQRNSNIAFDVAPAKAAHAPSVKSVGITGQMTGSRATRIIADDIESLNNSVTDVQRTKLGEIIKEFDSIITPDKKGEITFLGTPQSDESLYNQLPERGYMVRIWPVKYLPENTFDKYKGNLAPMITKGVLSGKHLPGESTEPTRFSEFDLVGREASYGRSGFSLQFMLDTTLSDMERFPLRLSDLIVINADQKVAPVKLVWASSKELKLEIPSVGFTGDKYHKPMWTSEHWTDYQGCVMAIDPSGRGKDETGYAVVKMLNGYLYLVASGGLRDGYSDSTLQCLANIAKIHGVNYITIESTFGDGMFEKLFSPFLARTYKCSIDPEGNRSNTQKEHRIINILEPVLNQHKLVVCESVIQGDLRVEDKNYQLFYQLTRLTKDRGCLRHDDRLDALAMAVQYWVDQMDKDQTNVEDDHRAELLNNELRKYMEHALNREEIQETMW